MSRGMNDEALESFNEALRIDPKFAEALYNKAEVLIKLSRKNEAEECYNKVIYLSDCTLEHLPENVKALEKKANALMRLGNSEEALNCYCHITRINPKSLDILKKIVVIDPGNANAWNNMGSAFYDLNNYEESLKSYDEAIELEPKFSMAWYNKGVLLGKQGKYNEAIECYEAAIRFDPQYAKAWYSKGFTLNKLCNSLEAIQCYNEASKLNPRYAKACRELVKCMAVRHVTLPIHEALEEAGMQNCGDLPQVIRIGDVALVLSDKRDCYFAATRYDCTCIQFGSGKCPCPHQLQAFGNDVIVGLSGIEIAIEKLKGVRHQLHPKDREEKSKKDTDLLLSCAKNLEESIEDFEKPN